MAGKWDLTTKRGHPRRQILRSSIEEGQVVITGVIAGSCIVTAAERRTVLTNWRNCTGTQSHCQSKYPLITIIHAKNRRCGICQAGERWPSLLRQINPQSLLWRGLDT
jgi:hypothetical protein